MRRRAYTLIEILIVVLIIGIILSIAVPQFLAARSRSFQKACMACLRDLEYAKELYAAENKLPNGAPCQLGDLWPTYLRGASFPLCPGGGTYTVGVIGETPTCSLNQGAYPHELY